MRRKRQKNLLGVGDVLMSALDKAGLSEQVRRLRIFQCWDLAVGKEIAQRTMPETISRGVLLVRARNATWQNELTFLKSEIIARLNRFLGQPMVTDLRVTSGTFNPGATDASEPPVRVAPALTHAEREEVDACAVAIRDPEVRGSFEHLMGLHLRARHGRKS